MATIFDFCENYQIILNNDFIYLLENRIENIQEFYLARIQTNEKFHLQPKYLYLQKEELEKYFNNFSITKLCDYKISNGKNFPINYN